MAKQPIKAHPKKHQTKMDFAKQQECIMMLAQNITCLEIAKKLKLATKTIERFWQANYDDIMKIREKIKESNAKTFQEFLPIFSKKLIEKINIAIDCLTPEKLEKSNATSLSITLGTLYDKLNLSENNGYTKLDVKFSNKNDLISFLKDDASKAAGKK